MSASPTYTVDVRRSPALAEIAASLPLSLAPAAAAPQIASIAGSPGWARRAQEALDGGALAAVVDSPTTHDDAALLPADRAGRVVIAWEFAANPGVLAAAEAAAPLLGRAAVAECTLTVQDSTGLDASLLDVLTAVGRFLGEPVSVATLFRGPSNWHLAGHLAGGAPLSVGLIVSRARPASLRFRLLTDDGGLTAEIPNAETAAPAQIWITGPDGERLLPTLWETSRRATWRRAVAIASGAPASTDVAELHCTPSAHSTSSTTKDPS